MSAFRLVFVAWATAICISSCSFRPAIDAEGNVTIRKPSTLMRNHGIREFESLKMAKKTTNDPRYTERVKRVSTRLFTVIDMPNAEWEFVIFEDYSPNAFCLPGGKIGVNTGLFHVLGDDDALLAAVLSHEISHATANHAEQRMCRALALIIGAAIVWHATDQNGSANAAKSVAAYTLAAYLLDNLPFSRKQEYESDKMGAIFMAKAGYNPRKSVQLWHILSKYHQKHGSNKPDILRTHPNDQKRIKALEAFIPIAMKHYKSAPRRNPSQGLKPDLTKSH